MPRPRKDQPSKRINLTLEAEDAARLDIHASAIGRPPATAAARLLAAALKRDEHDPIADQLAEAQTTIKRLENIILDLEAKARGREILGELSRPRWARSMHAILDDGDWLDAWLPELYSLLGRQLDVLDAQPGTRRLKAPVVDERGYADLMAFLFPDLVDQAGTTVTWRSLDYPHWARIACEHASRTATQGTSALKPEPTRPIRAEVWEPVVRHVVLALCSLEETGKPDADPLLKMRTISEIRGVWLRSLGALIGHSGDNGEDLQPHRLPAARLP